MSQLRQLCVTELQVGQFIILPPPWHKHPFLRSRFRLENLRDVEELAKAGILRVTVDEDRSHWLSHRHCRMPLSGWSRRRPASGIKRRW